MIDALLPQTQCTKCSYQGCKPYAEAIAQGEAINKCPPGGEETIKALAALLDRPVVPLEAGQQAPAQVAYIHEAQCIGCTKCMQACPVDAIVGAARLMHTIITFECTGCELCVVPCPVDCIEMRPIPSGVTPLTGNSAQTEQQRIARQLRRNHARKRFENRHKRLERLEQLKQNERQIRLQRLTLEGATNKLASESVIIEKVKAKQTTSSLTAEQKRLKIEAAMAQVALKKAEKQLQQYNTPELKHQVELLRTKVSEAQQALTASQQG